MVSKPQDEKGFFCCIIRPMIYDSARVSTNGQSVDAQVKQSRPAGADKIFRETRAARRPTARSYRLVSRLANGEVLLLTRLDRLALSTRDLLNTLPAITDMGSGFHSIYDAGANTRTLHGGSTGLGGLSKHKRELIRTRRGEGRERAKARGVNMGRRPKLIERQRREAIKRKAAGEATREIASSYNVSHSIIPTLTPGPFGAFSGKG